MEKKEQAVRIMSVLPVDFLRGQTIDMPELNTLRMYQVLEGGVLKENAGIKRSHRDYIVYDVTNASDELKRQFGDFIMDMEVTNIIKEKTIFGKPLIKEPTKEPKDPIKTEGSTKDTESKKITTLLSLLGEYGSLSREEKEILGYDFVNVEDTIGGIKITPALTGKDLRDGETYLRINENPIKENPIPHELLERISGDITELAKKENGLYEFTGYTEETKKEL